MANVQIFFFFLLSITGRSEDINKYLNNVSIFPVDITQSQLNGWAGTNFDLSKLDFFDLEKNTMADAVVKCLKHMNKIPNSNLVRNADGLLSRREVEVPIDRVGEYKEKFKVSN